MMQIGEGALQALNTQLGLLAEELTGLCDEDASYFLFEAWGADGHEKKAVSICHILLIALYHLEEQTSPPPAPQSISDVYALASPRGVHFSAEAEGLDYRLLHYLATEVQAGLLLRKQRRKTMPPPPPRDSKAIQAASADNKQLAFELNKICQLLSIDASHATHLLEILDAIRQDVAQKIANGALQVQETACPLIFGAAPALQDKQVEYLTTFAARLFEDHCVRRQMLLERLDVTLSSFAGSNLEESEGAEQSPLLKVITTHRTRLSGRPRQHHVKDALMAPVSLLHEQCKPVANSRRGRASLVKKAIIGQVPDRGGRVNELRASNKKVFDKSRGSAHKFHGKGGGGGGGKGSGGGGGGKPPQGAEDDGQKGSKESHSKRQKRH